MRESERNVGWADNNLAGARSMAQGEAQPPEKVVDQDADADSDRAAAPSDGSEGSGASPADRQERKGT